ncbi:MAG: lysophospholipid acyltransferase family protein [Acidobacteriota bacterium]
MMAWWSFIVVHVVRPLGQIFFTLLFRMEFHGLENIPREGAIILTPNHVTYMDPVLVGIAVKRRLFFMTWSRLFDIPILSITMRIFGAFPVRLEGHDLSAVRRARAVVRNGKGLVIFPEGGRTTSGKLDPFKMGAFRLAVQLGVPIVPVTINGAYQIWPPKQRLPRLTGKITIHYHPPIPPVSYTKADLKIRTEEVAQQVRISIASNLDPTLVPEDLKELQVGA